MLVSSFFIKNILFCSIFVFNSKLNINIKYYNQNIYFIVQHRQTN